jgi:hypothetical protein
LSSLTVSSISFLVKEHKLTKKEIDEMVKEDKEYIKYEKDNRPKKRSAFIIFSLKIREQYKNENNKLEQKDLLKKIGSMWTELGEEERKPFNDK